MGQKEKLIEKLLSKPRNFTFNEAETLLGYFSYCRSNKGKTSGSCDVHGKRSSSDLIAQTASTQRIA